MEEDDLALASLILALADMGISAEEGARVFRQGARTVQEAVGVLNGEGLRPAVLAADNLNDNWEEHFAADPINCPYYYETQTQTTQWEEPAHVRRKRLQLASEVFAVDISRLERVDGILQGSHDSSIYSPQAGGQVDNFVACIFTLRRIFENIVDSPAQDKYRTLRKQNAKFSKVWALPAVRRLLSEVGFIEISETVALPMAADLGPLRFAASRLQLAEAVEVASSSGRAELHREGVMPAGLTEEEARAAGGSTACTTVVAAEPSSTMALRSCGRGSTMLPTDSSATNVISAKISVFARNAGTPFKRANGSMEHLSTPSSTSTPLHPATTQPSMGKDHGGTSEQAFLDVQGSAFVRGLGYENRSLGASNAHWVQRQLCVYRLQHYRVVCVSQCVYRMWRDACQQNLWTSSWTPSTSS
eukprot:CAMPEP_0118926242 /NCGR_PEP_ID=MMETSP1169-20130426/3977_1 /TAXON_ID=36882 /ORGANISM="Pyramimonas obovata, Strain CCMP722" /LENGTH=416 /DNA_ID=CAMNT_0006867755 /DNA_START=60 /DNA_END=1307 /DNA_ORIENTATION=+